MRFLDFLIAPVEHKTIAPASGVTRVRYYRPSAQVTVCLVKSSNGDVARGISICSLQDPVNASRGRVKAKGKAIQALTNRHSLEPIVREEAMEALGDLRFIFGGLPKADFNPELFIMEAELING